MIGPRLLQRFATDRGPSLVVVARAPRERFDVAREELAERFLAVVAPVALVTCRRERGQTGWVGEQRADLRASASGSPGGNDGDLPVNASRIAGVSAVTIGRPTARHSNTLFGTTRPALADVPKMPRQRDAAAISRGISCSGTRPGNSTLLASSSCASSSTTVPLLAVPDDSKADPVRLQQLCRLDDRRQALQRDERPVEHDEVRHRRDVRHRLEDVLLRTEPEHAEAAAIHPARLREVVGVRRRVAEDEVGELARQRVGCAG